MFEKPQNFVTLGEHEIVDDLVNIMENVLDLPVKLKVEVKTGKTWFKAS